MIVEINHKVRQGKSEKRKCKKCCFKKSEKSFPSEDSEVCTWCLTRESYNKGSYIPPKCVEDIFIGNNV